MGTSTDIQWTDATWNPVRGCSRVSPGCERCYAETMAGRFCGAGQPYHGLVGLNGGRGAGKRAKWTGVVRMVPDHLADPLKWKRPRRIFVNSMSDLFHEKLSNEEIAAVFGVMAAAPRHAFQALTKRAERMRDWFRWLADQGYWIDQLQSCVDAAIERGAPIRRGTGNYDPVFGVEAFWPLRHVWLGVSVEDQRRADERIPRLLDTPAAVRFISAEPLLGPVVLQGRHDDEHVTAIRSWLSSHRVYPSARAYKPPTLDWVIVGAESGRGARQMDIEWARALRDQCAAAGVPFFLKQFAERGRKISTPELDGRRWVEFPEAA